MGDRAIRSTAGRRATSRNPTSLALAYHADGLLIVREPEGGRHALTDHFGQSQVPFLDMAANQDALATAVANKARPTFADLGLSLESLQIQNVSLPDELQKRLDERIGMGIVGDLSRYTQYQVAQSIPIAAAANGAAGAGVGIGAGIAMGQAVGQAVTQAAQTTAGAPPASATRTVICAKCLTRIERPGKFCPECGVAIA
ncbi:MAG: hypothetical protein DMD91_16565 [Candidatus Rokuibacteriota bacterium]|nr:MAG: hypothetical protein DMD91_16565 [Candidatus Rokubacteria bacterium]